MLAMAILVATMPHVKCWKKDDLVVSVLLDTQDFVVRRISMIVSTITAKIMPLVLIWWKVTNVSVKRVSWANDAKLKYLSVPANIIRVKMMLDVLIMIRITHANACKVLRVRTAR